MKGERSAGAAGDDVMEALLDGRVSPSDAPPHLAAVASVLQAASAPPRADEQELSPDAVRRIFEEARRPPVAPGTRRREVTTRRWPVRAAVAAVIAGFTISGGAALAATGNLPAPIQSAAHSLFAVVGIDVPDTEPAPADLPPSGATTDDDGTSTTTSVATTTTPPIASTPPVPTTDASGLPGQGDEVCEEASDGRCQAGDQGSAGDGGPSVTRPPVVDPVPPTTGAPPPVVPDNPSVTRPENPSVTRPENPSVTRPETPSVTRPENPSATAPGQTKDKTKEATSG